MGNNTIFLVDDDSDDRFFMQQAFSSCGITDNVIEAESVPELIVILKTYTQPISLIIIDMNMPMINGLEAIPQIRSVEAGASAPIVMVSTSPSPELATKAVNAGVSDFMPKPNTFEEFGYLVKTLQEKFLN